MCICLPLTRLGLPVDAHIQSIETSCDCVVGEEASFIGSDGNAVRGVMVRIGQEFSRRESNRAVASVSLAVQLKVQCLRENLRCVVLRFTEAEFL